MHGVVNRTTRDLDFFCTDAGDLEPLRERLRTALTEVGLSTTVQESSETFVRLMVTDGDDETFVDLASDFRLRPPVETPYGTALSLEELAADKLLALFSRAEARDFVDAYRVSNVVGFERMEELAQAKDSGFSRRYLAEMLGWFDRHDRAEFEVDEATYQKLGVWVRGLRLELESDHSTRREPPGLGL